MKKTLILILVFAFILSGCGSSGTSTGDTEATEVIVGTGSNYNPYCYLDENNQLTGFEKAVLDEIDARLPQYTLTYQIFDFSNILLSLEAGKIDVGAHQYEFNIERNEKYLYGDEGYTTYEQYLVVREDDDSISSFEDLAGKVLVNSNNSNNSFYVSNKWNEEHGNPFTIIFRSETPLMIEAIEDGTADAMISIERNVERYKEEYNAKLKISGPPVSNSNAYHIYNKQTGAELKAAFDGALRSMKEDGTLVKLSEEWLGGDYTPKD